MKEFLILFEKRFTIFSLIFFTGVLSCSSLSVPSQVGEGATIVAATASPIDSIMSKIQGLIYLFTFFLISLRWKTVISTALKDKFLLIMLALVLGSVFWSDFPDITFRRSVVVLQTTIFSVYLASRYSLKEQLHLAAWSCLLATGFSLLYTLAFPGSGIENGIHAGAWRGPLVHKNILSRLMVMNSLLLLIAALSFFRKRWLFGVGCGLSICLVMLTTSKSALFILLLLLILIPLFRSLRFKATQTAPIFSILILLFGGAGVWLFNNWDGVLTSLDRDPTLTGRTVIWEAVLEKIMERPFVGYGFGAFWQEGGGADYVNSVNHYSPGHAHNGFINLGADLGFLGLASQCLSYIFSYRRSIDLARSSWSIEVVWPISVLAFLFLYNITESTIIEVNSIFWVMYVSISLSLKRLKFVHKKFVSQKEGLCQI